MPKRMQSPSSINIFKQCPRKYFYQYIVKLPTRPSIHLIRGSVVHEVLEKFFEIDIDGIDQDDFEFGFRSFVSSYLLKLWKKNGQRLMKLGLPGYDLEQYLIESQHMLNNFVEQFSQKLRTKIAELGEFKAAFKALTPAVEEEIRNEELNVRGFIDAIHEAEHIVIMDYKTSKKDVLTPEYRLQLGIYALLYKEKYDRTPDQVGINFLKFGEQVIDVDDELLADARREIIFVHEHTATIDIKDYDKHESGLCKWRTGQCDFYDVCFKD